MEFLIFFVLMCGIFAVSGESSSANLVLKGLKSLEYRGYDSWGIAFRATENGSVQTIKSIGKISEVEKDFPASTEAFGHTRWATHGGVTNENAHPHQVGKVTIVHNGICENYKELQILHPGHTYVSETDTEVIAAVLAGFVNNGATPFEALKKADQQIHGRYALVIAVDGYPGLYGIRRGSPLIIGRAKNATFIASDIPAFLPYTSTVNYLDDGEAVHCQNEIVEFKNIVTGKKIEKRNIEVPWKAEDADKGNYEHFMIKEIFEQKETLERAIDHKDEALNAAVNLIENAKGIYVIACGTAHKVAMASEYFFANISSQKINVVPASEMDFFKKFIKKDTLLIAISQSGETADVLDPLEYGQAIGAKILAITNVASSTMARIASVHLPINAGPEKAVASTKATTAQMALMLLLAYATKKQINIGRAHLYATAGNINDMLNPRYEDHIRTVAADIVNHENIFTIGRGSLYPMALEAALKILEVSYIHAQGFAAGELKHGPIALITEGTPVLVLGDDPQTLSNAMEVKSRGAMLIGIAPKKADIFDWWIRVPDCDGAQALATIIPVQILAYHLAVLRGLDPDKPRNLAKSVTVK
jgi:glucosamine--fructose-6-phosphate aminotransferase (isomerizing)